MRREFILKIYNCQFDKSENGKVREFEILAKSLKIARLLGRVAQLVRARR